jgi:hypothetical protein
LILKPIADYIKTFIGFSDVYYSQVVASPDTIVSVLGYPGYAPDVKFNYNYPRFQIRVRSLTYDVGNAYIWDIFSHLQRLDHSTLSGIEIIELKALQEPYILEIDEKNRFVFQTNYEAQIYYPTLNRE